MPVANRPPFASGDAGSNDFFSRLSEIIAGVGNVINAGRDLATNPPPIWNNRNPVPTVPEAPTYRGDAPTTSSDTNPLSEYMPIILIGAVLIVVVVIAK